MTSVDTSMVDQKFLANAMASFLQIGAVFILLIWCYQIVSPFYNVIIFAVILSIAVYPGFVALTARLGGRTKLSATLIILIGITLIAAPAWLLAESTIGGLKSVATELADGTAVVPPPADSVAEWPVIGEKVHQVWSAAGNEPAGNSESV